MNIRKFGLLVGVVAIVGCLSLALSSTAGADTGYPGTTTVTSPGGPTSPGSPTAPGGPTDPCVISPTSCIPAGTTSPGASSPSGGSGATSGTLAFTGADLLALIIGALFLLAAGTLLVIFTRRRAARQHF